MCHWRPARPGRGGGREEGDQLQGGHDVQAGGGQCFVPSLLLPS